VRPARRAVRAESSALSRGAEGRPPMPERRLERAREHQLTEALQAPLEASTGSFQAPRVPDRAGRADAVKAGRGGWAVGRGLRGSPRPQGGVPCRQNPGQHFSTFCIRRTGLVPHVPGELPGSFASLLGRSGPRLGQGSHFLSPLVRPRGSRHIPENPQSDHTGRRTERSRTHTMRTRIFER